MTDVRPIFLFTDFGLGGPYVGQMSAAILAVSPHSRVIDLMHDAPAMRPDLAAYLLPACCGGLPRGSIVVAVVDPGVGGERAALLVESDGRSFVGPDNGLLSCLPRKAAVALIDWRPQTLSASFHGRDLFAPAAARLAAGMPLPVSPLPPNEMQGADWPAQSEQVVYVDGYGNCMTGIAAENVDHDCRIRVSGQAIGYAETFCRAPVGTPFWYVNSQGLVEIAANGASAADLLSLAPGSRILLD